MSTREIPIDGPDMDDNAARSGEASHDAGEVDASEMEQSPEERIAALEADVARLRDQALRAVADLENVRRRAVAERYQLIDNANEQLLRQLLPLVDDFRRSVESGAQTSDFQGFYQGVAMVNDKLAKLLESQGVKRMETIGKEFDVEFHEALMRQPSDAPEDTVITEVEPGYMLNDRVLRHAKVIVSAGSK